jgi:hypothetical protein
MMRSFEIDWSEPNITGTVREWKEGKRISALHTGVNVINIGRRELRVDNERFVIGDDVNQSFSRRHNLRL